MEQEPLEQAQPRRRVRRSAEQWASLIAAQAASGLSIATFCRERGLAVSSFHAWRRRLVEAQAVSPAERGFVRLRVQDEPTDEAGPAGSQGIGGPDGCVGDNPCNAEGNHKSVAEGRGDGDAPD